MSAGADLFLPTVPKFSPCRRYRFILPRGPWDPAKPACNFVMLNPSTADENVDDPTIRRCMRYAHDWGYGSLLVTNLFALRATDPRELYRHADPVGPGNDDDILTVARSASVIVCAWGEHGWLRDRARDVRVLLDGLELRCLKQNKSGQPVHPLYQPAASLPVVMEGAW